ncbi:MAG: thiamine pyrophosphate-dependent enzyme [Candidatus Binatia bacterium]
MPYWGYPADVCIVGEVVSGLEALTDLVSRRTARNEGFAQQRHQRVTEWGEKNAARRQMWKEGALAAQQHTPIDLGWLCHEINQVLPKDAIVVEETITSRAAIFQQLDSVPPGGYVSGLSGGLGLSLGIALGVKCANPDKVVVNLVGDGSFNYNPVLAAFGCAQEYRLPTLTIVINNGGYQAMRLGTQQIYPQGFAVQTQNFYGTPISPHPDYAAIARAFDGYGETVDKPDQIRPTLQRGFAAVAGGKAALIDVVIRS